MFINSITNQQYNVITEALNQNQRIVYDTFGNKFVSLSRAETKYSNFDKNRYISDLGKLKEKIEEFVKVHDITTSQKEALTTAFSKRAAKRSWLIFTSSGSKQLTAIRQSILKIANHKEKIPQDSRLASSPGPQCNATHHIETKPIHLTQEQFHNLVSQQLTNEKTFAKKMETLVSLSQDKKFRQILMEKKPGRLGFSKNEINKFFKVYNNIAEASQLFQRDLTFILGHIQTGHLHYAMQLYEDLHKKYYDGYAKALAVGVTQVNQFPLEKRADIFRSETAYRDTVQPNPLGSEDLHFLICEPMRRAESHWLEVKQISLNAQDSVAQKCHLDSLFP